MESAMKEPDAESLGGCAREVFEGSVEVVAIASELHGERCRTGDHALVGLDPRTILGTQLVGHVLSIAHRKRDAGVCQ